MSVMQDVETVRNGKLDNWLHLESVIVHKDAWESAQRLAAIGQALRPSEKVLAAYKRRKDMDCTYPYDGYILDGWAMSALAAIDGDA